MAFPKLTATEEMKQIAASDMPRKEKTKYGYVTEVCDYYVYLRCVVQAGILKAALFFPDYLRLDGNNPVYEVYLDKENRQFTTYDCLNQKWSEAKLDRLDWKHWYAKSSWVSEEEAAVIQTYLDNDKRGASAILQFQRAVRDEQLVQRHRLETDPWDKDLEQVPELPKDWNRWVNKVAIQQNYIYYHYKKGGAKTGYCTYCEKEVPIKGHPHHNQEGYCSCCRHPVVFKAYGRAGYMQTEKYFAYLIQRCKDGFVVREFQADRTYGKESLPNSKLYCQEIRRTIYDRERKPRTYYWGLYEEEEQVILDNLQTFPIAEWKGLSMLTEHQRDMMRQPFLGSYLFCWHQNERKALELLEQNRPLQRVCILLYRYGVRLFLSVERLKDLRWMKMTDVGKFRRLLAVFEYDAEDLSAFFGLWLDNHAGQYDLNWFISQPHPLSKEQREEILCNQLSYLNALYAGRLHLDFNAVRQFQFSILIYAVEHRKKHFLELVDQNSEVFLSLGRYSLLFEPGFCEHCNINSLTLKNLKASDSVNRSDSFFTLLEEGQQYTFEEMYQLWHQKEVYVRLYTMLTPLSIDQRLLTLRQLIKRDLVSQYTGDAELEQLGKCLLERPFSEWYRGSFGHICGLTRRIAMGLLQHYTQLQAFIPDFTTESDAVFTLNNMTALLERTDWKQVRKDILTTDADWLDLKEKLAFSDDFVEQNRETVTEFLLQGGAAMVRALYGELDGQELAVEALRRIVQAELMGQFYKLKYFAGDLQREIRYPVSEMQESLWKKNLSLARGAFWAEEVDDFYHTLRLGELPHSTCLSYRTGSQRECLLAAFDSNKKIVLVKKDEAVVARACLRLTKGAFQKPPAVDFSFADLSQENMDIGKPVTSEKPVLFLESIYTFGLNDIEKEEVMKLAVSLTTQKAAELGVVAVLARRYLGCYERDEYVLAPFYVYISKSKNGWQYLDSLGGAAYTSAKEEYVEHPFLVIQTAMHHAGAHNRNEVDYE